MVTQPENTSSPSGASSRSETSEAKAQEWALLSYRIPRQPSTPRIAVWRRLKELGVAQIGDGLVALPDNPKSREDLQWVSASVAEAGGEAMVWVAKLTRRSDSTDLIRRMREARTTEYQALIDEIASGDEAAGPRTIEKWRRQWRKIDRRDYHRSPGRDEAKLAISGASESPDRTEASR